MQISYVVYEKNSTLRIDNLNGGPKKTSYATRGAAAAARTRFLKDQQVYGADDILVEVGSVFYNSIEKEVSGKSAMDGRPVTVKANTPRSCDPRFEAYWSA
jgi:hypothetical protein